MTLPLARPWAGIACGIAGVAAVTAAVKAAAGAVNASAAPVVYQLLVLVVSGAFGAVPGLVTGGAAVVAFNWFFIEPHRTLTIAESRNWVALAVFAVTAVITSRLAGGAYRFREETRARRRDADTLARLSDRILAALGTGPLDESVMDAAADALEVEWCRVVGPGAAAEAVPARTAPDPAGFTVPLLAGRRIAGALEIGPARPGSERWANRDLVAAVAGLLAVAVERSRLIAMALESEALRRSDELKSAVIQGVSHDFRTPITAIRNAVDALGGPVVDADRRELLAVIGAQAARLDRLVANLIDLSRLEGGALAPRLDACDPEDLVGTALAAIAGVVDPADVVVVPASDPPMVSADPVLVERVLVNLVHNAATHGRPPIRIEIGHRPGWAWIAVQDAGPGLSEPDAGRAFLPFEHGRGSGTLGIGLAIARGLAEAQGGSLVHEPTPVGARFVLTLPAVAVPALAAP